MRAMNDSSLEMELERTILSCIKPLCGDLDYFLTLMLAVLFVGYFIWEWHHG
jgi:hypothetical protein